jgi:hypothetical protein
MSAARTSVRSGSLAGRRSDVSAGRGQLRERVRRRETERVRGADSATTVHGRHDDLHEERRPVGVEEPVHHRQVNLGAGKQALEIVHQLAVCDQRQRRPVQQHRQVHVAPLVNQPGERRFELGQHADTVRTGQPLELLRGHEFIMGGGKAPNASAPPGDADVGRCLRCDPSRGRPRCYKAREVPRRRGAR